MNVKDGLKNFCCVQLQMLSANQIVRFSNQLYLKKKNLNQFNFWHVVVDSRNIKGDAQIFDNALCQSDCRILESNYRIHKKAKSQEQGGQST